MSDDLEDQLELVAEQAEIPVWPNLPDVPTEQRRRAWCLATSLESLPQAGKSIDIAKAAVAAAAVFEDYITEGRAGPKLVKE